eukprot:6047824-Prorocentrum_lima.AAC.1
MAAAHSKRSWNIEETALASVDSAGGDDAHKMTKVHTSYMKTTPPMCRIYQKLTLQVWRRVQVHP